MSSQQGIEDLLFETLDAISRFRVGQREAVGAALEAGGLLREAKGRLKHGEFGEWLGRVGLAQRMAWKGRPGTANGANLDEASIYGPDSRGSH